MFNRCSEKNAAQRVRDNGGVSVEEREHRAELECNLSLQSEGRGAIVQERHGRGPVRRSGRFQANSRDYWLDHSPQSTLGKNKILHVDIVHHSS